MFNALATAAILAASTGVTAPSTSFSPYDVKPEGCEVFAPPLMGSMEVYPNSKADSFNLNIHVGKDLCEQLDISLATYEILGDYSNPWPQKLVDVTPLQIKDAGVYEVSWMFPACGNYQFDPIIGSNVPDTINIGGDHGPLIKPLDTSVAHQHFGSVCTATSTTTTTTVESTTTTVTPSTTTTTTTLSPSTTSTSVTPTSVEVVPTIVATRANVEELAYTGVNARGLILIALVLIGLGTVLRKLIK